MVIRKKALRLQTTKTDQDCGENVITKRQVGLLIAISVNNHLETIEILSSANCFEFIEPFALTRLQ